MNVKRLRTEIRTQLKLTRRNASRFAFSVIMPAVFLVFLGFAFGSTPPPSLAVVDEDGTEASQRLVDGLQEGDSLDVQIVKERLKLEDVETWLRGAPYAGLLWIHAGYGENATAAANASVLVLFVDADKGPVGDYLETTVRGLVAQASLEAAGAAAPLAIERRDAATGDLAYRDFLLPGMVGLVVLSSTLFGTVTTAASYRQMGVLKKLATTPLRKSEWILGQMSVQFIVALLGSMLLVAVALLAFQTRVHLSLVVFGIIGAGALAFAALGFVVAGLVRDAETATLVTNLLYLPMMFLSGTFFPLEKLPGWLELGARLLPLTHFVDGLRASMILEDTVAGLESLAILLALAAAFVFVGARVMDWSED